VFRALRDRSRGGRISVTHASPVIRSSRVCTDASTVYAAPCGAVNRNSDSR
jgi:hypothetical protein